MSNRFTSEEAAPYGSYAAEVRDSSFPAPRTRSDRRDAGSGTLAAWMLNSLRP